MSWTASQLAARQEWALDDLDADPRNLSLIDPMDAVLRRLGRLAERQDEEPPRRETNREPISLWNAADVLRERALLALTDPEGEAEAVQPLSVWSARRYLIEEADVQARRREFRVIVRGSDRREDGRDLLTRIGADPSRVRGVIRCPAHEDRSASLSWRLANDGRALLHCFAGCTFAEILAAA